MIFKQEVFISFFLQETSYLKVLGKHPFNNHYDSVLTERTLEKTFSLK